MNNITATRQIVEAINLLRACKDLTTTTVDERQEYVKTALRKLETLTLGDITN